MFNMSNLSIEPESTEKSYTFLFKDTSSESTQSKLLDMLPKQNWDGKLTFLLLALNLWVLVPFTNNNYYHCFNANSSKILPLLY